METVKKEINIAANYLEIGIIFKHSVKPYEDALIRVLGVIYWSSKLIDWQEFINMPIED